MNNSSIIMALKSGDDILVPDLFVEFCNFVKYDTDILRALFGEILEAEDIRNKFKVLFATMSEKNINKIFKKFRKVEKANDLLIMGGLALYSGEYKYVINEISGGATIPTRMFLRNFKIPLDEITNKYTRCYFALTSLCENKYDSLDEMADVFMQMIAVRYNHLKTNSLLGFILEKHCDHILMAKIAKRIDERSDLRGQCIRHLMNNPNISSIIYNADIITSFLFTRQLYEHHDRDGIINSFIEEDETTGKDLRIKFIDNYTKYDLEEAQDIKQSIDYFEKLLELDDYYSLFTEWDNYSSAKFIYKRAIDKILRLIGEYGLSVKDYPNISNLKKLYTLKNRIN